MRSSLVLLAVVATAWFSTPAVAQITVRNDVSPSIVGRMAYGAGRNAGRGDVHVRGHVRSNGSYVQPHYRSSPDGNFYNNYSTNPNVNPYTGRVGSRMQPSYGYGAGGGYGGYGGGNGYGGNYGGGYGGGGGYIQSGPFSIPARAYGIYGR